MALSRSIVVADDNIDNAESLVEWLRIIGYKAEAAFDGAQAVELCTRLRPGVAILDVQMPVMDGAAAARIIRLELDGKIVIASMSALRADSAHMKEIAHLFDANLPKPASTETLRDFLEHSLPTLR